MGLSCMGELTVPDDLPPRWRVLRLTRAADYLFSAYGSTTASEPLDYLTYVRQTYAFPDGRRVTVYVDDRITLR